MCGILWISEGISESPLADELNSQCTPSLKNRGPDSIETQELDGFTFTGSVLWQQGSAITKQPVCNSDYVLLFNGDIFNAAQGSASDTDWLFGRINQSQCEEQLLDIFRTSKGPYSFVLFKRSTKTVYFARDSLGRNSLIMGKYQSLEESLFYVSSVNGANRSTAVMEVPPLGIYAYDVASQHVELHAWEKDLLQVDYYAERFRETQTFFQDLNISFSLNDKAIGPNCFDVNPQSLSYRFDELEIINTDEPPELIFESLLTNSEILSTADKFIELLSKSVKDRVTHTTDVCRNCPCPCDHPKVGVLFSGGVDCSLLAVLADSHIPQDIPINLYNVAFSKSAAKEPNWDVPDRISAKEALEELRKLAPNRIWNLVQINIPRSTVDHELRASVSPLVYPLTSVLDESLGGALWFASRHPLRSERVLLLGSGADELLGGYTRHRRAFQRGELEKELLYDWHRLPSRNLARDDRVIGDNGVTPRSPFVEEDFVAFVRSLHPMQRCFHGLAEGVGDKLLLRLAAFKLGLRETAVRRKRALQFGSRIADSRQNAKDKSKLME